MDTLTVHVGRGLHILHERSWQRRYTGDNADGTRSHVHRRIGMRPFVLIILLCMRCWSEWCGAIFSVDQRVCAAHKIR